MLTAETLFQGSSITVLQPRLSIQFLFFGIEEAASMAGARYYIFKDAHCWKIGYDGKEYVYKSNADAVMAAIKAANETALHGFEAEVLVQGIDGKWRTEWSGG